MEKLKSALIFTITFLCVSVLSGVEAKAKDPTIKVTPKSAFIQVGKSKKFIVVKSGKISKKVNWFVNDIAGGDATVGTISEKGVYTAPATLPDGENPVSIEIKAVSIDNPAVSGKADVGVFTPPAILSMKINPSQASVVINSERTFTITMKKKGKIDDKTVKWFVYVEEDLGKGDGSKTTFTLANQNIEENSETVKVDGVEKTRDADYTINYAGGEIEFVSPPGADLSVTASYFIEGGNNTVGKIVSKGATRGVYTAPAKVSEDPTVKSKKVNIKAVSNFNEKKFAEADITITKEQVKLIAVGIGPVIDFGEVTINQEITIPIIRVFTIVTNTGDSVGWQASRIPTWLRVNPSSGGTGVQVTLEVIDTSQLNVGLNQDTVVFLSGTKGVKPLSISVFINARSGF